MSNPKPSSAGVKASLSFLSCAIIPFLHKKRVARLKPARRANTRRSNLRFRAERDIGSTFLREIGGVQFVTRQVLGLEGRSERLPRPSRSQREFVQPRWAGRILPRSGQGFLTPSENPFQARLGRVKAFGILPHLCVNTINSQAVNSIGSIKSEEKSTQKGHCRPTRTPSPAGATDG